MKKTGPGLILIVLLLFQAKTLFAVDKVDIGIFESPVADTLVIKARPNYNLASPWYITNITFTIRWPDTSSVTQLITISSTVNSTFSLQLQQSASNGGYRYQLYSMVGQKFVNWTAGNEYPILEVKVNYPGGDCTEFEISDDNYTRYTLNGRYWFEVVGSNKTGIRYQPSVSLVTIAGTVSPDETICLGSNTSLLTLSGHSGTVLSWQKKHDAFAWADISGTAGLTQYTATPDSSGTYLYRATVQRATCAVLHSSPATIGVERYSQWTGAVSTNWASSGNWNICGVPTITRDVIVPIVQTNNYPIIQINAYCRTIVIKTGATVTLGSSGALTVGNSTAP